MYAKTLARNKATGCGRKAARNTARVHARKVARNRTSMNAKILSKKIGQKVSEKLARTRQESV